MNARWLIVVLVAAACGTPRSIGSPVRPAAAGPIDLVRSLWGDYGGRCPGDYHYCKGEVQAVCCPLGSRCEEDDSGSYCVSRSASARTGVSAADSPPRCRGDEIPCSYQGQTTCCAPDQRCCNIDGGPGCCG